jgi:hypothetical protein
MYRTSEKNAYYCELLQHLNIVRLFKFVKAVFETNSNDKFLVELQLKILVYFHPPLMLPEREFVKVSCGHSIAYFYLMVTQNYLFRCSMMADLCCHN